MHPAYEEATQNPIKEGLMDLAVELANNVIFHVYCYGIEIFSEDNSQ